MTKKKINELADKLYKENASDYVTKFLTPDDMFSDELKYTPAAAYMVGLAGYKEGVFRACEHMESAASELVRALEMFTDYPEEDISGWVEQGKPVTITVLADAFAKARQALANYPKVGEEGKEAKELPPIPEWIVNYDKAGHQSSAGKAIRFLMEYINNFKQNPQP